MAIDIIKSGDKILFIWGSSSPPENMESTVNSLKEKVGDEGSVQVEHAAMLLKSGHDQSTFDVTLSGTLSSPYTHTNDLLAEILKTLKPNAFLVIRESIGDKSIEKIKSTLQLSGFTSIDETLTQENVAEIHCQKPNFEVGKTSRLPLSFAQKAPKQDTANVWTLSAMDMSDDDVDIIDSDALLDADDLKRPDLSTIKTDCGTNKAGKRKACKGCTCGLSEELETGVAPAQKSACGSCYLGDAFRCASCPYLGMPPFKPGEQVTLSERQLNPDK